MKTLAAFYSFGGHTKAYAQTLARAEAADLLELLPAKPVGKLRAYAAGCLAAMRGKAWELQPFGADLAAYDRILICGPIWAGNVAPYINRLVELLPPGKEVRFTLVSASKQNKCAERLAKAVAARGCTLLDIEDVKG